MTTQLPQLDDRIFLTDSGLETILVFDHHRELPCFASFLLLDDPTGTDVLVDYFETHATIARDQGVGAVLDTPTWRASANWGHQLGYDDAALRDVDIRSAALIAGVRDRLATAQTPIVINGCIGPSDDGYRPSTLLPALDAATYHRAQIEALADGGVDLVTAMTMTYSAEAIGIVHAARCIGLPVAVSFTVETDGRLPSGESLGGAIAEVDRATDGYAAYFLVNCAHPTHFAAELEAAPDSTVRIRGVRCNGSRMSHAELDEAESLDSEAPDHWASQVAALRTNHPQLTILGGCCGTNHLHLAALGRACAT
jgi:S-methylmethionine-dependent homocysteine/selenocysteine methylase